MRTQTPVRGRLTAPQEEPVRAEMVAAQAPPTTTTTTTVITTTTIIIITQTAVVEETTITTMAKRTRHHDFVCWFARKSTQNILPETETTNKASNILFKNGRNQYLLQLHY